MKSLIVSFSLLAILLAYPAVAQDIMPPSGSRVVAGAEGVLLSWPGAAKAKYLVQLTAGQVIVAQQEVAGPRMSLQLRPGLGYQWKVSRATSTGYQEVVPPRNFQVVSDTEVAIKGVNGKDGKPGSRASNYRGGEGEPGKNGLPLTATLPPMGEYVALTVTGAPANRQFLFAPGAGPLLLSSVGGSGGAGGPGYKGRDGEFFLGTRVVTMAEPGGDGGLGGKGGDGGTITVISNGLEVRKFLQFDTRGGDGGAPGAAGLGGRAPGIPIQLQYRYGYAMQPGPSGQPGTPGMPGREGQVFIR